MVDGVADAVADAFDVAVTVTEADASEVGAIVAITDARVVGVAIGLFAVC